jgi:hypothetical protein
MYRAQLSDAHAALAREVEMREKLEENMKQAFMRGEHPALALCRSACLLTAGAWCHMLLWQVCVLSTLRQCLCSSGELHRPELQLD